MASWEVVYKATVFAAEEMGVALRRSAFSPNIRERGDLSCAIADAEGAVVAQAEHIPVHLGSFRVGIRRTLSWLRERGVELGEGDVVVVNDPYVAGTHLNDVMLLAPVHHRGELVAYVVNKAHHVDLGGPVPGSINPQARTIFEEGLVVPPVKLAESGTLREDVLRLIAANSRVPRAVAGDLHAQLAAVRVGARRVVELMARGPSCNENYDSSTGEPLGAPDFGWSTLVLDIIAHASAKGWL